MARWVLPVLVGPRTAVTPAPRARASRGVGDENERGIRFPGWEWPGSSAGTPFCITMRRQESVALKQANKSGTNRARIADSHAVQLRSPRHIVLPSSEP